MLEVKDLEAALQTDTPAGLDQTDFYQGHLQAIDSIGSLLQNETKGEYIPKWRLREMDNYLSQLREDIISTLQKTTSPIKRDTLVQQGKLLIKRIEDKITDMHTAEEALLVLRSERLDSSTGSMKGINLVILAIALILAGYSWISYYNENVAKKKANSQINEYAFELEKKVIELTAANKELIQLRGLQKFTSTGRIARMIAHEVRNPLTNINLSYDQLKDILKDEGKSTLLLDTIMRNSTRINSLVSELLNATKAQELKFEAASVNALLDETLEIAKDRIELEHIQVRKNYDPDICEVSVDKDKIKIAFLNIILNAVEAMPSGDGLLTLQTKSENNKCVVSISDNGRGMDQDTIDKIFDPYFTGKSNGNGLGLTNTQNIILNHKGTIDVESKIGQGSTFTITLDFYDDEKSSSIL